MSLTNTPSRDTDVLLFGNLSQSFVARPGLFEMRCWQRLWTVFMSVYVKTDKYTTKSCFARVFQSVPTFLGNRGCVCVCVDMIWSFLK